METRKHIAAEKKRCGSHNCAQAILHTYADIAGIDEETAMNIANAFGAGMGRHIMTKFQERNGATQCKLLKGVDTKVVLRECPDCVADAAEFLEELISTSSE